LPRWGEAKQTRGSEGGYRQHQGRNMARQMGGKSKPRTKVSRGGTIKGGKKKREQKSTKFVRKVLRREKNKKRTGAKTLYIPENQKTAPLEPSKNQKVSKSTIRRGHKGLNRGEGNWGSKTDKYQRNKSSSQTAKKVQTSTKYHGLKGSEGTASRKKKPESPAVGLRGWFGALGITCPRELGKKLLPLLGKGLT